MNVLGVFGATDVVHPAACLLQDGRLVAFVEEERFARRIMHETPDGIRFQYDMRIADNFRAATEGPQGANWHLYEALAGRPLLILRGELSDLLSSEIADRMVSVLKDDAEVVEVPAVGHTPNLEEPEAQAAMDRLLERVMARQEAVEY